MKPSLGQVVPHQPESAGGHALRYRFAGISDQGRTRALNEDAFATWPPAPSGTGTSEGEFLAVVADGMGGHAAGEVASQLAVETVIDVWRTSVREPESAARSASARLRESLRRANEVIFRASHNRRGHQGMGTTCTALLLRGPFAYSSHVGDSRLYLRRGDTLLQLTEDDSAVMDLVRRGLLTERQASSHPERNVLIRAMGTNRTVELQTLEPPVPLQPNDVFVLCSDGLHDLITPEELGSIIFDFEPGEACITLVNLANRRGGFDNITAVVVRVDAVPAA